MLAAHLAHAGSTEGLIFAGRDGGPVKRNSFVKAWGRAVKATGQKGLRFHDPRHVYASALIRRGSGPQWTPTLGLLRTLCGLQTRNRRWERI